MAFNPSQFLRPTSEVILRDQQHAARLFTDDQFRLAPKQKFLFHVAFSINPAALQNIDLVQRHKNEINMMVKSCDLPSFAITTETLNQYNRKKNVQTTHKYNNINVTFHDDNMGLVNQLWQNYYTYYYADPSSAADTTGAYNRNATRNFSHIINTYGLDNGSTTPFFNSITIYQMARHEYVSYKLHNPIITSWNHNKVEYSQNSIHDNTMQLQYEAVSYGKGLVASGDIDGFGTEHYDQTPSPLRGGGSIGRINPSFAYAENVTNNALTFVDNLIKTVNGYQNENERPLPVSDSTIINVTQTAIPGLSGVPNTVFPVPTSGLKSTVATVINLNNF